MQRKDYYAILGVARNAQESEIKIAYRKLALKNHPDTNRDDLHAEDRFKEINEAYDVLSNGDKRNHYDLLSDSLTGSTTFRPSPFDRWNHPFEASPLSGFGCRGGGIGRALARKRKTFRETGTRPAGFAPYQSDLHIHDLSLKSNEVFEGTERDIRLHIGQDTIVFTVSIPAGVENGTLLSFRRPVGENQEIELLFRVTIAE